MATTMTFPQEIQELIVDALGAGADLSNDKETLAALLQCTQVSHALWVRARQHIFAKTEIIGRYIEDAEDPLPKVTPVAKLVAFVDMCTASISSVLPVIALVQSFTLHTIAPYIYIWSHQSFIELLKLFIASEPLHSLSLRAVTGIWPDIDRNARELLHTLVRTPHLKTISLRGFLEIDSDIFNGCTVKNLLLYSFFNGQPLSALSSPPLLEWIETDNMAPVLSDTLRAGYVPFPHVKKVKSIISLRKHLEVAGKLARGASLSLHTLELIFKTNVFALPHDQPLDLGQLPSLRHLTLGFQVNPQVDETSHLRRFCAFLYPPLAVDTPHLLETVEFKVYCSQMTFKPTPSFVENHWRALDEAVTQPHLARVRKVQLKLHFYMIGMLEKSPAYNEPARELITPLFPRVASNKAIDFDVEIVADSIGGSFRIPVF